MTEACPNCGAHVTYFASDVGDTIPCRGCGAALRVTSDGLQRAAPKPSRSPGPPSPPGEPAPAPSAGHTAAPPTTTSGAQRALDTLGMLLGFLFLPGLFLTLLFMLLPV